MIGTGILCTRGLDTESLISRARDAVRSGRRFTLIALEDVPDDWMTFTSFAVGGGGAWPHVIERMAARGFPPGRAAAGEPLGPRAAAALAAHLGTTFKATFQAEAGNATLGALTTAERLNVPLVDACPSGRCLPEVQMSPFLLAGIPRTPLAAVTRYGDQILLPSAADDFRVEDLTRALAVASGGAVTVAANAVTGRVLKQHLIPGFLSRAMRIGRAARQAAAAGRDPVEAVAEAGGGFVIFRGIVRRSDSRAEGGFGWTDARLDGVGPDAGQEMRIFVKNENMVAWRDGRLAAAAPDLITALDPATGWAMRGGSIIGSYVVGQELSIVGFPAPALWRSPAAIALVGPGHFGFDDPYVPIETLVGQRRP